MKRLLAASLALASLSSGLRSADAAVSAGFGNALSLTGSNSTSVSGFTQISSTSFTLELWFKASSLGGNRVLAADTLSAAAGGAGRRLLYLKDSALATDLGATTLVGKTALTAGTWYHAALVHDTLTRRTYLYLNGSLDASGSAFARATSNTLTLGASTAEGSSNFVGAIDEVRVWGRRRGPLETRRDMNLAVTNDGYLNQRLTFDDEAAERVANDNPAAASIAWGTVTSGTLPGANTAGGAVSFAITSQPAGGTVAVNATTGQFTYTRTAAGYGADPFTYSLTSGGVTQSRTVSLTAGKVMTRFTKLTGVDSPLYNISAGSLSAVDMDLDGKVDLHATSQLGTSWKFHKNIGTAASPAFDAGSTSPLPSFSYCSDTGTSNAFAGQIYTTCESAYGLGSYVLDQDMPLYVGISFEGNRTTGLWDAYLFRRSTTSEYNTYHKPVWVLAPNAGSLAAPSFLSSSVSTVYNGYLAINSPSVSDLVGGPMHAFALQQSAGVASDLSRATPIFDLRTSGGLSIASSSVIGSPTFTESATTTSMGFFAPLFSDLDGDGDLDLMYGGLKIPSVQYFPYQENTGRYGAPSWREVPLSERATMFSASVTNWNTFLQAADLDGDGDNDLLVGSTELNEYYRNDSTFRSIFNAPVASSTRIINSAGSTISDTMLTDWTVSGAYTYADADADAEGSSTWQWEQSDSNGSASGSVLATGTRSYTLGPSNAGKYMRFCVTPSDGLSYGARSCSGWSYVSPTVVFYDNTSYGGASVTSPYALGSCIGLPLSFNDRASAIRLNGLPDKIVVLRYYGDYDCSGGSSTLVAKVGATASYPALTQNGFDNTISSFRVVANETQVLPMNGTCYPTNTVVMQNELSRLWNVYGTIFLQLGSASTNTWTNTAWAPNTGGMGNNLCLQGDGNLVMYNAWSQPVWASNTSVPNATLRLQTDCNLVIYDATGRARWASSTNCAL